MWITWFLVFHILFLCTARPSFLQNSANRMCRSVKKVVQWAWVPQPLTWLQSNGVGENNRLSGWWMPSLFSLLLFFSCCSHYFFSLEGLQLSFYFEFWLLSFLFSVFKRCFDCIKNKLVKSVAHLKIYCFPSTFVDFTLFFMIAVISN